MRRLKFEVKCLIVAVRNLVLFVELATRHGIPLWRWPAAWRGCKADHEAHVRKTVFELRMAGRVRQDADGRLWSRRDE